MKAAIQTIRVIFLLSAAILGTSGVVSIVFHALSAVAEPPTATLTADNPICAVATLDYVKQHTDAINYELTLYGCAKTTKADENLIESYMQYDRTFAKRYHANCNNIDPAGDKPYCLYNFDYNHKLALEGITRGH